MARTEFDVIVIGGGPAGYAAALRAARLGFATLCIDDRGSAGGTCLHVGCIPSKALLASTERYDRARDELADHGVSVGSLDFDLDAMMARKQDVVDRLTSGVDGLLEKRGVARLHGRATLQGRGEVRVATDDEEETRTVAAPHVLLATGSAPATLPGVAVDGSRIVSSDEAIALSRVPEHLAVVGGGYIGLELGSVWRRLGADVTVVEVEDQLLPGMDVDLAEALEEPRLWALKNCSRGSALARR